MPLFYFMFDPLTFWKGNWKQFPTLARVACSVFACLAASSAAERASSEAADIYSKRRGGNMKPSAHDVICFLHSADAKELEVSKTSSKTFTGFFLLGIVHAAHSVLFDKLTFLVQF